MALTAGSTIVGTTTLAALIDQIYANRVGLAAGGAVFTALDATTIKVGWPGVNNGDSLFYIYCNPRAVAPAAIVI